MAKRGNLFVISGPTAAGKGTICAKLCERREDIRLSVSCATRAPRKGEIDGTHYFFISDEQFDAMIQGDELLEFANVHGKKYGTPLRFVMDNLEKGIDVLLEIDVQGAQQVINKKIPLTPVFVIPPSKQELLSRLRSRGTETEEQIATRLRTAREEMRVADHYDYIIVNEELDSAVKMLESIIDASHAQKAEHMTLLQALNQQFQELDSQV